MHAPILETPGTPSTEEPAYVEKLFGPTAESAPAPALICDVVGEVSELSQAAPETVTAVAVAVVGAALGPKVTLVRGRGRLPVTVNIIVSHQCPRTLPWMDALVAAFAGRAFELEAALLKQGQTETKADIANREKELQQARRTLDPNPELLVHLQAEAARAPSRLKPFIATSSLAPKELCCLLPRCFDSGVTIVAAGNDPGDDFLRMKAPERAHLAELVNRAWQNTPLSFGNGVYSGNISLLWETRLNIKDLLGTRGFDPAWISVPALFMKDKSNGKPLPEFAHESEWQRVISSLFDHRCLNGEAVFTLSHEADGVLSAFGEHIAANLGVVPAALRPHVCWLSELAPRLAFVTSHYSSRTWCPSTIET